MKQDRQGRDETIEDVVREGKDLLVRAKAWVLRQKLTDLLFYLGFYGGLFILLEGGHERLPVSEYLGTSEGKAIVAIVFVCFLFLPPIQRFLKRMR